MVEKELPSESVGVVVKIDGKVQVYQIQIQIRPMRKNMIGPLRERGRKRERGREGGREEEREGKREKYIYFISD